MKTPRLFALALGALLALGPPLAPREARAGVNCGHGAASGNVLCEGGNDGCVNQFGQAVPCPLKIWPPDIPLPQGCNATHLEKCTLTPDECSNIAGLGGPYQVIGGQCIPPGKSCTVGTGSQDCHKFPIVPFHPTDPNDKVGTLGAADAGFVPDATPLHYAVHFENLAAATGAAQVVLITDQLDSSKMDLNTFQLGPMSVGNDIALIPSPGLQTFLGGIDLRPDRDLILTVNAALDRSTGLVTWRFTSIDPATGQLTEDPAAGFLPPNVNPPAGEGSVVFTVMPKRGLATNTAIRNQAQVVFDTNASIATPTWLNTIDKDPPVTHVLALAPTQTTPTFNVQWAGTDAGAGIRDFSIYVSDNGGPFILWQDHATALSAAFTGTIGHTYGFFALGTDLVGNVESPKTLAEATTQIVNAPACASNVSAQIQVTRSGFGYNFATQRFVQTVTLKNMSGGTVPAPISLVLDSLSSNATLYNATGTTACATPAGSPFINWSSSLAPGASASIVLQFTNPSKAGITYATRVLAGSGGR